MGLRPAGRSVAAAVALAVAGPMLAAGAGDQPAGAASTQRVKITHGKFAPTEVRIAPGDTVTWVNQDHDAHSVTADDGSFDSHPDCSENAYDKCLAEGASWSHTFANAGRFPYHSKTEGQKGVVVVTAS